MDLRDYPAWFMLEFKLNLITGLESGNPQRHNTLI
jgi:hypothetical protein